MRLGGAFAGLSEELGLASAIRAAPSRLPFTIYWNGTLHPAPLSVRDAITTRLVSWPGKLRALGDLLSAPPAPGESVAEALRRKLGPEVYTRLAGPIIGGLYFDFTATYTGIFIVFAAAHVVGAVTILSSREPPAKTNHPAYPG
jgi:oxygen-dependent protoporphyrinogen oxidase